MHRVALWDSPEPAPRANLSDKDMTQIHKSTRIGDLLVERRLITSEQLHRAVELQHTRRLEKVVAFNKAHLELGEILIELGFIDRRQLKSGLSWQRRLRKTTAMMVFIAPLLTAACGGGAAGGAGASPSVGGTTQSSLSVSSQSSSEDTAKPVESSSSSSSSNGGIISPSSSSVSSSVNSSSVTSSSNSSIASSNSSSVASSESSVASSESSISSSVSSVSSSSSSSAPSSISSSSTSSSSSQAHTGAIDGPVQIFWTAPAERENGDFLDITEVGGYEIRYKLKTDTSYQYIDINDPYVDAYYFDYLQGDYEFEIATFDNEGLYSNFVAINPS